MRSRIFLCLLLYHAHPGTAIRQEYLRLVDKDMNLTNAALAGKQAPSSLLSLFDINIEHL
ncbi:hypothetical protein [Paenibacillus algorifonticola]|uniref:hypothetical protein n=1 Tax=Paenibacillus algorifonticola TaxID=684063 RepID=UPI0006198488|nr:hypothetical protein [Paenibacillus algorifonticola]